MIRTPIHERPFFMYFEILDFQVKDFKIFKLDFFVSISKCSNLRGILRYLPSHIVQYGQSN